jgi:hypothetical protein
MKTLLLLSALSTPVSAKRCPVVLIHVLTPESWSEMDEINLEMAKKRCPQKYKRSPCLKKFIRWKPLRYGAICGPKEEVE